MIITTPAPESASDAVEQMYADDLADDGFVHSCAAAMAVNPEAHDAFVVLRDRAERRSA